MKLLIVSEAFGPSAGIAGHRIGSFAVNLAARGVSSLVIAGAGEPSESNLALADVFQNLEAPVDDAQRRALDGSRVAFLASRCDPPRFATHVANYIDDAPTGSVRAKLAIPLRKAAPAYAAYTYSAYQGWVRRAIDFGERAAKADHFDVIVASAAAEYWNFGVAHALGKRLRLPVVLDLRDDWDIFLGGGGKRSPYYLRMHPFYTSCARVVCATASVAASVNATWPNTRTVVVHNGIDLDGTPEPHVQPRGARDKIVVGILGTFWSNAYWDRLAEALARLAEHHRVEVLVRGRATEVFETVMCNRTYPSNLTFDLGGLVPKATIIEMTRACDVLVAAVFDRSPGAIPSKIYDAIGLAKPLLVLGDSAPDYLVEHLAPCQSPWFVVDQRVGVEQIVEFLLEAPHRPPIDPRPQREHYSRRARADELHAVLRGVAR